MLQFRPSDAIEAVRKNLDEQGWNPSAMFGESADNDELNETIRKTIPEAIDAIHLSAPVEMLESCETAFAEDGVTDGVLDFHTEKPVLRLVSVKSNDSEVSLASFFPETSPVARLQSNHFLRGTRKDPVLVKRNGTRNRFKYYTVGSRTIRRPVRIADSLYEMYVDNLDYEFARNHFLAANPSLNIGGCSSVQAGEWYGRNLDWLYDNGANAVVRTPAKNGRYAVLGVAGGLAGFTDEFVDAGYDSDLYRLIPFYLQDGVNSAGVFANINVYATASSTPEPDTTPLVSEEDRICTLMLVRYILDNFSSAKDAVEYIRDHVALYNPQRLRDMGYEVHFMVGDRTDSDSPYIMEMIDGELEVIDGYKALTNFQMYGITTGTPQGANRVFTQADIPTAYPTVDNSLDEYSQGLERWNLIDSRVSQIHRKEEMRALMDSLFFTNAYKDATDPFWHSEFVGRDTYSVDTPITDDVVKSTEAAAKAAYGNRDRNNPKTWHTTHSSVYNLNSGTLYIVAQEDAAHEHMLKFGDSVPERHLERVDYITYSKPADEYEISAALLKPVMDELTALVLAIYGETEKAKYFFEKANIQQ